MSEGAHGEYSAKLPVSAHGICFPPPFQICRSKSDHVKFFSGTLLSSRSNISYILVPYVSSSWSGPCLCCCFHFNPQPFPGAGPNHVPQLEHRKPSHLHTLVHFLPPVWNSVPPECMPLLHGPHHPHKGLFNIHPETVHKQQDHI